MKITIPSYELFVICDYVEYMTFLYGECNLYLDVLSDDADGEVDGINANDVLDELERRLVLYGIECPYSIHKKEKIISSYQESKEEKLHYLYSLYYSLYGGGSVNRNVSNLFESIVDVAIKNYLNTDTSILTSFAQNSSNLKNRVQEILAKTKEELGNINRIAPHIKDGGIDIITYKSCDDRGNQIIILTDATIGKNWSNKKVSVVLSTWTDYIHFKAIPHTALAIVQVIKNEEFYRASRENGLVFDRCRIMKFYTFNDEIQKELIKWEEEIKCVS